MWKSELGLLRNSVTIFYAGDVAPALETLQKMARALETPLYQFFYEGEYPPRLQTNSPRRRHDRVSKSKGYRTLRKSQQALASVKLAFYSVVLTIGKSDYESRFQAKCCRET
jgi:hypothetical protein